MLDGLKRIHNAGHFIVEEDEQSQFALTFEQRKEIQERILCNVPFHIFIKEILKFFAQMVRHNGMSSCQCMWCMGHPSEWCTLCHENGGPFLDENSLGTIKEQMSYLI
jgi:hypothetical protein